MSIWVLIWIFISVVLLGFLAWSLGILYQQKKGWKAVAEKHKLRYKPNASMEGPEVGGVFQSYKINCFTGEHAIADMRGTRKMTAIEVTLESSLPTDIAVASGGMVPITKEIGFKNEIVPEHKKWTEAHIAVADNKHVLSAYLTDERIEALTKLMGIARAWVILIHRSDTTLLRVDIADPLGSAEKLEKLMKLMVKTAKVLEVSDGEYKMLESEEARGVVKDSGLSLDDSDLEGASSLSLEEDEEKPAKKENKKATEDKKKNPAKKKASKKSQGEKPSTKKS